MKCYEITIKFTINKKDYKRYDKNIDQALDLLMPYGTNYDVRENEIYEDEE